MVGETREGVESAKKKKMIESFKQRESNRGPAYDMPPGGWPKYLACDEPKARHTC